MELTTNLAMALFRVGVIIGVGLYVFVLTMVLFWVEYLEKNRLLKFLAEQKLLQKYYDWKKDRKKRGV